MSHGNWRIVKMEKLWGQNKRLDGETNCWHKNILATRPFFCGKTLFRPVNVLPLRARITRTMPGLYLVHDKLYRNPLRSDYQAQRARNIRDRKGEKDIFLPFRLRNYILLNSPRNFSPKNPFYTYIIKHIPL